MALPSFTQHLDVLERCGLVTSPKRGRVRTYCLATDRSPTAEHWMTAQREQWERRLDQLDDYLEHTQGAIMTIVNAHQIDPDLDLVLEREVDVPVELVWAAWTTPEHITKWFTPAPWTTPECEIDLRPGGIFRTVMRSPEGEEYDNAGCYLEVVENERLVWTARSGPASGRWPRTADLPFTAVISMEPTASGGTRYTAIAMHGDPAIAKHHDEMGFHEGWGAALDQLVALAKTL